MKNWSTLEAYTNLIVPPNRYTPGRNGQRIEFVVLHHNAGSLTAQQIRDLWATQRTASAHYQVDRAGDISQHVDDWNTAWHANNQWANERSIGIEHANGSGMTGPLTPATLDQGAKLTAAVCRRYGLGRPAWGVNVFPHSQFSSTACPGPIAGAQRGAYMSAAAAHYDQMTTGNPPPPTQAPTTEQRASTTMVDRFPLTWEETKDAARNGAAIVSYGTPGTPEFYTWGSAFPQIYAAAKLIPGILSAVQALAVEVGRLSASQAAQDAALIALRAAVADEAASDDIDVDAIVAAITAAGQEAAEQSAEVLREALDGATLTLDTTPDPAP